MKNRLLKLIWLIIFSFSNIFTQDVRPIKDDVGYCWKMSQMEKLIKNLVKHEKIAKNGMIAGISPHDDLLYAANVYYPLFSDLNTKEVVIFGVTHGTVRKEIGDPQNILIFDNFSKWTGLDGTIEVSKLRKYIVDRLDTSYFIISNKAHTLEHSIEGMIPFLNYFNPKIKITPIMVTAMSFQRTDEISNVLAEIISSYIKENNLVIGEDIFFLISADANHYGNDFNNVPFGEDSIAHQKGINYDKKIIDECLDGEISGTKISNFMLKMKDVVWCGKYSIPMGLMTAQKVTKQLSDKSLKGKLFKYSDTYTGGVLPVLNNGMGITAPFSLKHWVGFFSMGFFIE